MLTNADAAMYEAKNTGKARYAIFDPTRDPHDGDHYKLEGDMRRAIECGEFSVHYQPVVQLDTGRIAEVEALVRWEHPSAV